MSSAARTALVTGAGRGLGRALAGELLARGWRVIAGVRDPRGAGLEEYGERLRALPLDLSSTTSILALADQVAGERIDLLLHNAAIRGDTGGLTSFEAGDFLQVMSVNVAGPLRLTRALIGGMADDARVVFISSRAGSMGEGHDPDGDYAYCCSKAALNRAIVKLRDDYPQLFLALHPGWVRTDMGGEEAEVTAERSAHALVDLIEGAGLAYSGRFLDLHGQPVGW